MTDDEDRPDGSETHWLAWHPGSYGVGFTQEQALLWMCQFISPDRSEPLTVDLVEYVGEIRHGWPGWEADHEVTHEKIEIQPDDVDVLYDIALKVPTVGTVLERAVTLEAEDE